MAEVTINIGDRSFQVVCQEGQEPYLMSAAEMLNSEAAKLDAAGGRLTESRMLLMAGLMLADRTAALEDQVKANDSSALGAQLVQEQSNTQRVKADLAAALQELAILKTDAAHTKAQLDEANLDGVKDMHEQLAAAQSEITSLTTRLEQQQAEANKEANSVSAEMLVKARTKRDEALADLETSAGRVETLTQERNDATNALMRVVEKLEAATDA